MTAPIKNPYPGARPLTEDFGNVLIGRDAERDALCSTGPTVPLVEVIGPSGIGKSSLVRAGFADKLDNSDGLIVRTFSSWNRAPQGSWNDAKSGLPALAWYASVLHHTLAKSSPKDNHSQKRINRALVGLPSHIEEPFEFIDGVQSRLGSDLVVIFDQLEELFRGDPASGQKFLQKVKEIVEYFPYGYTQVVSLREEYGHRLRIIESLSRNLWDRFLVNEIDVDFISEFVTRPLEVDSRGITASDDLVERIASAWRLARESGKTQFGDDMIDERQIGMLQLQGFLFLMFEKIKPAPGSKITAEDVATALGFSWPEDGQRADRFLAIRN